MATTSGVPAAPAPLRMTEGAALVFHEAVKYVLTEWPSLMLAIENGMGGTQAKQKQLWMCDHITEIILSHKDIELVDYLAELVNQEFDTLIEDGSIEYNAKWIEKFHKDCLQNKEQDVQNAIKQAALKKQSLGNMKIPVPVRATQESSDDGESDEDEDDIMQAVDRM